MSYFRDGVFNSENGLLKDYNTYEKLTTVGSGFLVENDDGEVTISDSVIEMIAKTSGDNTFQAAFKSNDSRYVTKINDYCSVVCQEIFDVTLPENKPVVNAGRYFRWHIKDSEADIAKASGAKLCAVDIDLNKAIDEYLYYSQAAKMTAINEEKFRCKINKVDRIGVTDNSSAGAYYEDCEKFKDDYINVDDTCAVDEIGKPLVNAKMLYPVKKEAVEGACPDGSDGWRFSSWETGQRLLKILYEGENVWNYPLAIPDTKTHCGPFLYNEIKDERIMEDMPGDMPGEVKEEYKVSPEAWCNIVNGAYKTYIESFTTNVESIHDSIKTCYNTGKIVAQKYNIDMGVELNYQTLFNTYTYSTESNNDENKIAKYNEKYDFIDSRACFEAGPTTCKEDLNQNGWSDTPFYLDYSISKYYQNEYYSFAGNRVGCGGSWISVLFPKNGNTNENFEPNYALQSKYPDMLKIDYYKIDHSNKYNEITNAGDYRSSESFKFYDEETGESYWNSIYLGLITKENYYKLDDAINACICKEGYVTNLVNGECICERKVSYYDFTSNYNFTSNYSNYKIIDDGVQSGTLTVEFMNGSGLYPISLKYWTLGNVSEDGSGHFDSIATNIEYSKNVPPKICSEEGDKTVCTYGDPDGVCRYVIKNRIIAHLDNETDCGDEPCVPCEDEPCGPEPSVKCIKDDGSINEECRDLAGLNVIYRVVDLNDPFPEDRNPGTNWIRKEGVITDNRGVSGMQLYSSSEVEPLYSFELTPAVIKEIRRDTANLDPAKKYTVGTVVYQNGKTTGGYSLFIHHTLSKYGTINLKDDKYNRFEDIITTGSTIDWGE